MKVNDFLDYRMQKTAASKAQRRTAKFILSQIGKLPQPGNVTRGRMIRDAAEIM